MVFYENILKRAREKQIKEGISYPKKDGKLYNFFQFFYVVAFIFANIWSLLYILAAIIFSEEMLTSSELPNFITVSVSTLIMFMTLITLKFNDNLIAAGVFGGVNVAGAVVLSETFFRMQEYSKDGVQLSYYWRHLVPFMIVCVATIGLTVIIFGAYFKTKKAYNRVMEIVYDEYNALPDNEKPEWEDFIKNYEF